MNETMEPAIGEVAGPGPGISIDWMFKNSQFGITRWNCAHGRREISDERRQAWHVVSFVHAGAFVLHSPERSALIDSTTVMLYNPRVPFRSEHPFGCGDHGSAIAVRREALLEVMVHHDRTAAERPDAQFPEFYAYGFSRAYLLQRLLIQRLQGEEPQEPMALEAAILRILGEVAAGCSRLGKCQPSRRRDPGRARRDYVEDAKALLHQKFRERLALDDISGALHVSTYHLCRIFKEQTGVPIHRYLNRLRMRQALESLATGQADLTGLALELGFGSHSHFTNAFRKEFGVAPREVRKLGAARRKEMTM